MLQIQIDPGARHGVLAAVAQQVIHHPPQMPSVRQDGTGRFRPGHHRRQAALEEFFLIFAQGLPQKLQKVQLGEGHLQRAAGGLGGFHQIFGQLFQPLALAVQYLDIGKGGLILDPGLF